MTFLLFLVELSLKSIFNIDPSILLKFSLSCNIICKKLKWYLNCVYFKTLCYNVYNLLKNTSAQTA